MSRNRHGRWIRFDLRFLLFWVMPYIAAVGALTTWSGPYVSGFLNRHARISAIIGLTIAWVTLYASRRAGQHDEEAPEPPAERTPP
jgi:hypothetical protein